MSLSLTGEPRTLQRDRVKSNNAPHDISEGVSPESAMSEFTQRFGPVLAEFIVDLRNDAY
jgi:hypothetical protein